MFVAGVRVGVRARVTVQATTTSVASVYGGGTSVASVYGGGTSTSVPSVYGGSTNAASAHGGGTSASDSGGKPPRPAVPAYGTTNTSYPSNTINTGSTATPYGSNNANISTTGSTSYSLKRPLPSSPAAPAYGTEPHIHNDSSVRSVYSGGKMPVFPSYAGAYGGAGVGSSVSSGVGGGSGSSGNGSVGGSVYSRYSGGVVNNAPPVAKNTNPNTNPSYATTTPGTTTNYSTSGGFQSAAALLGAVDANKKAKTSPESYDGNTNNSNSYHDEHSYDDYDPTSYMG